jgi:hypothetical protein
MPRILTDDSHSTFYTVDGAVGRNAPNDRLDVLLVQFLMFLCTKDNREAPLPPMSMPRGLRVATPVAGAKTVTPTHPRPQGNIVIDGICGNQTIGFIEYFQELMKLHGVGTEFNGQVAPARPNLWGTTIYWLNTYGTNYVTRPWKLRESDAFPQELKNSFHL